MALISTTHSSDIPKGTAKNGYLLFPEYFKFKSEHFAVPCLCQVWPGVNKGLEMGQTFSRHVYKQLQGKSDLIQKYREKAVETQGKYHSFHMGTSKVISQRTCISSASQEW